MHSVGSTECHTEGELVSTSEDTMLSPSVWCGTVTTSATYHADVACHEYTDGCHPHLTSMRCRVIILSVLMSPTSSMVGSDGYATQNPVPYMMKEP